MASVTDEQVENVRALIASIPSGRVATYGDIADAAGLSSARIVGWIMRTDSSDLPWHRVLGAPGRAAPPRTLPPGSWNGFAPKGFWPPTAGCACPKCATRSDGERSKGRLENQP